MPTYTVTGVAEAVRDWNSTQGGPMRGYRIDLRLPDGTDEPLVEWSRKANSPAPEVGMVVEGDIENGQYGKKFKKAMTSGTFGGPRVEDPKRSARIQRMHSQDMALRTIAFAAEHQLVEQPTDGAGLMALIAKTADWFDKDAQAAGDRA